MNIITLTDFTLLSIKFKLSVGLWHTLLVVHFWTCSRFWRSSKVTNFEDASFPSCWSLIKLSLLISKSWIKFVVFMKIVYSHNVPGLWLQKFKTETDITLAHRKALPVRGWSSPLTLINPRAPSAFEQVMNYGNL